MTKKEKKLIIISFVIAVFLISIAYFYQIGATNSDEPSQASDSEVSTSTTEEVEELEVGEPGSTHAHASFVMLVDGEFYNLSREKYYERSEYVHFHEGNGIVIHKHAKGVSLPYFLDTLDITITDDCVILDEGDEYCEEDGKMWRMVVNGNIVEDMDKYEIRHGDKIMLDYSDDRKSDLRVKAQATTPSVPRELMEDASNIE